MSRIIFAVAMFLGCWLTSVCSYAEANRPNVLFLICDDLNCDLGCYGHEVMRSPNIDRLAARGVRFENAHCQYPLCGPSRASFLAGLYPDQTLVHKNAIYLREHGPNLKTLPQMFRDAGYTATRIGKLFHYHVPAHIGTSGHDDPWSWDYTINPRGRDRADENITFSLKPGSFGGTMSWLAADGTDEEQTDGIAATEAIRFLQKYSDEKTPFFLAVGLYRPHTPYVAPKKYFELYPTEDIKVPTVPKNYLETIPKPHQHFLTRKREQVNLANDLAKQAIQAYYASATFADAQIGRILDALKDNGLEDNTVVVFTTDHGYHLGEHGHYLKTSLFENATRVPLIVAGPGVVKGTATTFAEMVDFFPTLAELCELKPPKHLSGKSLVAALENPDVQVRDSALTQLGSGYSVRTKRFRYTEWGENGALGKELYDRSNDPDEMVNIAGHKDYKEQQEILATIFRGRVDHAKTPPKGVAQFGARRRLP